MLNIVVPMAGHGSRFAKAGYTAPKPLIPIHGVPMIRLVIDNLRPSMDHRFIFLCQAAHIEQFALDKRLCAWAPGAEVRSVAAVTEGAACTVLLARDLIDSDEPLMIANCDQYIDVAIDEYLQAAAAPDGMIMTMIDKDPKWSFVGFDQSGRVSQVVEKQVISDQATVGIYNFTRGRDFVSAADAMIAKDLRVNNEFYVAPVYNELIELGAEIGTYSIGAAAQGMHGLGIPADLDAFLALELSRTVTGHLS
ncbi:glycosyltransferase family 2 protein [Devosia submarina]|uniref:glycosyltransferase family 2 protein n=1 Tax=Devosia submarina TaxID=1173082 RepID=UPI000D3B3C72|nr:glycosyltransferase family 2 protein [Devosia submarina]